MMHTDSVFKLDTKPKFMSENVFSTDVLIGNWFEDRLADQIDKKAVAPGIFGRSECINEISEVKDKHRHLVPKDSIEGAEEFNKLKMIAFHNRVESESSKMKMYHGRPFVKNMTTTTDILYRLQPKDVRAIVAEEPHEEKMVKAVAAYKRKKEDLMDGQGNLTMFGVIAAKRCEKLREERTNYSISIYKENFTPKKPYPMQRKLKQKSTSLI